MVLKFKQLYWLIKQCTCKKLPLAKMSMTAPDRALDLMYVLKVPLQVMLALEHARADVTLEGLDVTNTMYCGQVCGEISFQSKLPAANIALVSGVRMLWSASAAAAALSMRRVVVSADR